jgi:coenzyme F420 biosynthesis associated uncharacterized protein
MSRSETEAVVADLRRLAVEAERHVEDYTHLQPVGPATPIVVVDRQEWIRSNVAGLRVVTAPLLDKVSARSPNRLSTAVGSRVTGVQLGSALSYLAGKVLGQYEVFPPSEGGDGSRNGHGGKAPGALDAPGPVGRLSLVAPNIAHAEQVLAVSPRDFRLWVCLHEQTHRTSSSPSRGCGATWNGRSARSSRRPTWTRTCWPTGSGSAVTALYNAVRDRAPHAGSKDPKASPLSVVEALQTPAQRACWTACRR